MDSLIYRNNRIRYTADDIETLVANATKVIGRKILERLSKIIDLAWIEVKIESLLRYREVIILAEFLKNNIEAIPGLLSEAGNPCYLCSARAYSGSI